MTSKDPRNPAGFACHRKSGNGAVPQCGQWCPLERYAES